MTNIKICLAVKDTVTQSEFKTLENLLQSSRLKANFSRLNQNNYCIEIDSNTNYSEEKDIVRKITNTLIENNLIDDYAVIYDQASRD